MTNKNHKFKNLITKVNSCTKCDRMLGRPKVLSDKNGNINSKILFIAEAPGRLGADKYHIPLAADQSGVNFEKLLNFIGWSRNDIFISNAVICNPRKANGNNDTPRLKELRNCSTYLTELINILDPKYIVTLGTKALQSLNIIFPHNIILKNDVAKPYNWNNRIVFPLYHSGPRAFIHRPLYKQAEDYMNLKMFVEGKSNAIINNTTIKNQKMHSLVCLLLNTLNSTTRFKLAKLVYLIDFKTFEESGHTVTDSVYLREKFGPLAIDFGDSLNILKDSLITSFKGKEINHKIKHSLDMPYNFNQNELDEINAIINKYVDKDDRQLYSIVYHTTPMKRLLKKEKELGKLLLHKKVIFDRRYTNEQLEFYN